MFEVFGYFEQVAVRFSPVVLVVPGLVAVLLGLFVWLGGLGFERALAAVAGAVSGGICGFFVVDRGFIFTALLAGAGAFIAIKFERKFIVLLTAVLAAALGFAVLTGPYIGSGGSLERSPEYKIQSRAATMGVRPSLETAKVYAADFRATVKQTYLHMPAYKWAVIIALVLIFIAAGIYFWRLTSALCCATLGTILIFAGMILLLLYKGSAPISDIYRRGSFYLGVFGATTAFGTIEQLLVCPRIRAKLITKKEKMEDKQQQTERRTQGWRNR